MKNLIIFLFGFLFFCQYSVIAQSDAKFKEYKKIIKTYPYSDPDPIPHPQSRFYPYNRFDGFTDVAVDKEWTVIDLENDYLKVQIMPEIGGKIWSAIEKSTGKSFIYNNEVVKFRDVAMRGPWTSGGIEANYGIIGHTPNCSSPVDYLTKKNDDGSVSCFVGWLDLLTRTTWQIEIKLEKDKAFFTTKSFWYNATPLEQPYYHWMNVGIKAAGNLEFIYDGTQALGHGGEKNSDWKTNAKNGKDVSFYKNNDFGGYKSYHVFGKHTDFFGGYWHDEDFGMGRYSPYSDKAGKKIWIWGLSQQGMIWEKLLTDKNGQYVEIQSGRLFNQAGEESNQTPFKQKGFAPYATDTWTEYWFPVKGTKGFVKANNKVVLNLKEGEIWLMALQNIDSELTVKKGESTILSQKVSLKPMQIFSQDLPNYQAGNNLQISLGDNILTYNSDPKEGVLNRPTETPKDFDQNSAYALWLQGKALLQMRAYDEATEKLQASLKKEPYFIPALCDLAQLNYQRMNYAVALELARKALSVNTYDGQNNFLYGLINVKLNKITDAKDGFDVASISSEYRSAASLELAKIYFREKNYNKSMEYCEKSLEYNMKNITALQLTSMCYFKMGNEKKGEEFLNKITELSPLNDGLRRILTYQSLNKTTTFSKQDFLNVKNEMPEQTMAEYDVFFNDLNSKIDWKGLLPYHDLLFKNEIEKAVNLSPDQYFPFRSETAELLENVMKTTNNWKPKYYLALIKWHFRDFERAGKLFSDCKNEPDFAPFYAARAEFLKSSSKEKTFPSQYLSDLEKAAIYDPKQWRYGKSLAMYYIEKQDYKKALEVADKYRKMLPNNYYLGLVYAKTLILNDKYSDGITYMRTLNVLPNEGASEGRLLWKEMNLMQAVVNFRDKKYTEALKNITDARLWLENLGVGKPYQSDIDERLEDYLEAKVNEKLNKKDVAQTFYQKVKSWKNEDAKDSFNDVLATNPDLKKAIQNTKFKDNENIRVLRKLLF